MGALPWRYTEQFVVLEENLVHRCLGRSSKREQVSTFLAPLVMKPASEF